MLETLIYNIGGGYRHETLEGRDYLVAPMVMLTEGVHNGSNGPLYYPKAELSKTPVVWNHKPIVVYHPEMNGRGVSACDPVIMESRKVGLVLNSLWDGKLRSEAWLEKTRIDKVDPRIRTALENGTMMEVSTGLFTDNEQTPGSFNGKAYSAIARNYRPDHLALLPDKKGSCSIADGAGLLQVNEANEKDFFERLQEKWIMSFSTNLVANSTMSHQDVARGLNTAMQAENGGMNGYWPGSIEDVYGDFYVYSQGGKYYKRGYAIGENNSVNPTSNRQEVKKHTEYRDSSGSHVAPTDVDVSSSHPDPFPAGHALPSYNQQGDPDPMTTPVQTAPPPPAAPTPTVPPPAAAVTNPPVVNTPPVVPPNPSWVPVPVAGQPPATVAPVVPPAPVTPAPVANLTADQYIQNAPAGVREMLQYGLASHNAERQRLVDVIVANKANVFPVEQLKTMAFPDLQGLAALAAPVQTVQDQQRLGNYAGAFTAPPTANAAGPKQAHLPLPTLNFSKEEKKPVQVA